MKNTLTDDSKAIILLCGAFGNNRSAKPLSPAEYSSLARGLVKMKKRPADLLRKENLREAAKMSGLDRARLAYLMGRGVQLGFAVEEWRRHGIWIVSRSDAHYPARYKKHLKEQAPALLFGSGEGALLGNGGIGIVGSRNVDQAGEDFTREVATLCAHNRVPVISGAARGVDRAAMTAALAAGGSTIGILAENLLRKSLARDSRQAIADGRLLLLSPYPPDARFTISNAMNRNKLIYALADYTLVVSAEYKKGGTWHGAAEALKRKNPLSVFVRLGDNVPQGNGKLLDLGAIAWPDSIAGDQLKQQLRDLAVKSRESKSRQKPGLFDYQST